MRKLVITVLFLALFLAACGSPAPAEPAETEAPETTEAAAMPTVSAAERLEEVRPLYFGTAEQIPDRKAAVAILEELEDRDDPEVNYLLALEAYRREDFTKASALCEKAVAQNYDLARVLLGEMYRLGTIATPRDVEKAQALFRQAVDNGCAEGHYGLGDIHQDGNLGKINLLKAAEEFKLAAEGGTDPYWKGYAYGSLASVCFTKYVDFEDILESTFYAEDFDSAVSYCEQAAALWNSGSMYVLARLYANGLDLSYLIDFADQYGESVEPNPELAKEWAEKLIAFAEQAQDGEACRTVAYLYSGGCGMEVNNEKQLEWYLKGAELGDTLCMTYVGLYYQTGFAAEQDKTAGLEWLQKAADAGNTTAMKCIGDAYYDGTIEEKDDAKVTEWYEKAAACGDADAMDTLGYLCEECGEGEKGLEWYEKAAANGNSQAMNHLGMYYDRLDECEKAEEWYLKAVNMQNPWSMVNLSILYNRYNRVVAKEARLAEMGWKLGSGYAMWYIGRSFEQQTFYEADRNRAITFYKLAADAGYEKARDDLKRLGVAYEP